jgi:IS605 OrfB family transposase
LIAKYQRNRKCKAVTKLVLPLWGDKGRQIKRHPAGIRIPALLKKKVLPVTWLRRATEVWRGRRANLQSLGKRRLLHKIRNKQSRHTKCENYKVSKQIVDYAVKHRRAIVLEKLEKVRRGRMRRYVEKSQWSFYQLFQFILYKAALHGVMVMEADPAYTSQECSRCYQLSKPNGKSFRCGSCVHHDHRDANAAFTLAERVMPIGGVAPESESRGRGLLVVPFLIGGAAMRLSKQNLRVNPGRIIDKNRTPPEKASSVPARY